MDIEEENKGATEGASAAAESAAAAELAAGEQAQGPSLGAQSVLAALGGLQGGEELKAGMDLVEADRIKNDGGDGAAAAEAAANAEKPNPDDAGAVAADIIKKNAITEGAAEETEEEAAIRVAAEAEKPAGKAEKEEIVIDNVIFGGKKVIGGKEGAVKPIEYEGAEVANKYIKDSTGHENLESLVGGSLKMQEKVDGFDDMSAKVSQYEGVFNNLPAQLYEAIDSHLKGNDWKTPIMSKPNLDFSKAVEDQSNKTLVENYMPNKFSEEDWTDYKGEDVDPRLKQAMDIAIETSIEKFSNDRNDIAGLQESRAKTAQDNAVAMNSSIDKSIEYLEKNIDGLDASYVKSLKKGLGINKLKELFLNNDGTFREDAALRMVMAENGYSMMDQYKTIAERKTETKERQETLERTPTKTKAKASAETDKNKIRPELQQKLDQISVGLKKSTVY